jgi:hypothetical protein
MQVCIEMAKALPAFWALELLPCLGFTFCSAKLAAVQPATSKSRVVDSSQSSRLLHRWTARLTHLMTADSCSIASQHVGGIHWFASYVPIQNASAPIAADAPSFPPPPLQFYIVRVDAPPAVSTITTTADGCFVTVESGPHGNLALALDALQHPTQRVSAT